MPTVVFLLGERMNYELAFSRLIGNEGSYVNNPKDPGGETNWGVTWPVLHRAIGAGIVPPETTIKSLTRDQSKLIYKAFFWDSAHADELDGGVAFQLFDWAVNSGPETAIRGYQRALNVAEDGHFGPLSLAAAKAMSSTDQIMRVLAERLDFMRKLSTWPTFGSGWAGRIAADLRDGAQDA